MNLKEVFDLIREEILTVIRTKTGWGKNELELEIERALTNALTKICDRRGF